MNPNEVAYTGFLEAGDYYVYADAAAEVESGDFSLSSEIVSELGGHGVGDNCGDAQVLGDVSGELVGDSFLARDDVMSSCSADGAADTVYRLDIAKRSRLTARIQQDEGRHVLALAKGCAGKTSELVCSNRIDKIVAAGTYYLIADGTAANAFGRFKLNYRVEDLTLVEQSCASAPTLTMGQTQTGSTKNGQNLFSLGCSGGVDDNGSADKVYRFSLARKATVRAAVTATDFPPVLAIRGQCSEASSERGCVQGNQGNASVLRRELEPGTYYVIVDGRGVNAQGDYSLTVAIEEQQARGARRTGEDEEGEEAVGPLVPPRPMKASGPSKAGGKVIGGKSATPSATPSKGSSKAPPARPMVGGKAPSR